MSDSMPSSVGLTELGAAIHPTRLAARLDVALSAATVSRLQKNPRLQARLAAWMLDHEHDSGDDIWAPDLLLMQDPRRAALLAGSIWHARSLLQMISKQDLAILVEHVGAEVQAFGIRHLTHAVASELMADPKELALHIERDGYACLGAWLDVAPPLERSRVLLRLPAGVRMEIQVPEHQEAASSLLSLVVAHFTTEQPTYDR